MNPYDPLGHLQRHGWTVILRPLGGLPWLVCAHARVAWVEVSRNRRAALAQLVAHIELGHLDGTPVTADQECDAHRLAAQRLAA